MENVKMGKEYIYKNRVYKLIKVVEDMNATWYTLSFKDNGDTVTTTIGKSVFQQKFKEKK